MIEDGAIVRQFDVILSEYEEMRAASSYNDLSDLPKDQRQRLLTRAIAVVTRVAGTKSPYAQEIARVQQADPELHVHMSSVLGVARGLQEDLEAGYLRTLEELVHADLFGDFMDMAQHLLDSGYKDAAAVIAGSALEAHLRAFCRKPDIADRDDKDRPKKLDRMNADLAKGDIYTNLNQKGVTAWSGLRNKAAHGKYAEYEKSQVDGMVSGVTDFIRRHPG